MFTHKDIKRLAATAGYTGHVDSNRVFPHLSKAERQEIIKSSGNDHDRQIAASIELQRIWRGFKTRSFLFSILYPAESPQTSIVSSAYASPTFSELRASLNSSQLSTRIHSSLSKEVSRVQVSYHNYTEEFFQKKKEEQAKLLTFQGFCALIIQKWWRKRKAEICRKKLPKIKVAIVEKPAVNEGPKLPLSSTDAAKVIQNAWRRHIDQQVYRYYKQLIDFKDRGDPRYMLRCINPKEAELLDSASGIHVRFRLGGEKFPPGIYYKIFTHRNVADIGTFAPRTYTKAENKSVPSTILHNRGIDVHDDNMSDWYERFENNGWRPVNEKVLKLQILDPITALTCEKRVKVPHEKLLRQQDVEKRRRQRKIEWMKKMYKTGMLKAKSGQDEEVTDLVQTATKGLMLAVEESGSHAIEDWEVDELLEWTDGLNFDSYANDWHIAGTTSLEVVMEGLNCSTINSKDDYAKSAGR